MRAIIYSLFLLVLFSSSLFAFSDQTTTERIVGENKEFINFLNICVTNFGKDQIPDAEKRFREIYQTHFNAQVSYLQGEYKNSFYNIRLSQEKQVAFSGDVLKKVYLEEAKVMLDKLAPEIIRSKNARARLYLTLGYRDRAVGRNFETVSDASNPKLFSYKVYRYLEGIKLARRAKRYGMLALYESRDAKVKKEIFDNLLKTENEGGNKFFARFVSKSEQDIFRELNKTYEESEAAKKTEGQQPKDAQQAAAQAPKEAAQAAAAEQQKAVSEYESRIEQRVRFRKEKTAMQFLLHAEYDRAEEVIREYIDDFNFKLILSTLKVLSGKSGQETQGLDLAGYVVHHYDNYSRVYKSYDQPADKGAQPQPGAPIVPRTMLDVISESVKVTSDIPKGKDRTAPPESAAPVRTEEKSGSQTAPK